MADVLIRGMEMPKNHNSITITIWSTGDVNGLVYNRDGRIIAVREIEAIELPPHGRLIDADALILEKPDLIHRGLCFGGGYRLPEEIIESATVIEESER